MTSDFSTHYRTFRLKLSEFEEDDLLIEEMSGHEALSQLFEFSLRLLSHHEGEIDPNRVIAKKAVLSIEKQSGELMDDQRHWHGVVSRFKRTGRAMSPDGRDVYTYECDIVPWFWFLTQHEDCRIFQNKTVKEIIESIFGAFEYSDFRFDVHEENHPTIEYCTQYHETTFDFISRLCEREGIYYYFRHDEDDETKHLLVFTDNNGSNPALDPDTHPYHHDGRAEGGVDAILSLLMDQQMRTRKVTLRDWDFAQKKLLQKDTPTLLTIGQDRDLERYRYPGGFVDADRGQYLSRVVMEAEEASHMRFHGHGQVRVLTPGYRFTLIDHLFPEFNIEYIVLSVWHQGRNNMQDSPATYQNEFTLQPKDIVWRPPLSTPKGHVRGPQTALVVGPPGEEIHTDEHGRVKIQFHWDRLGQYDDKSSCWVRVAQIWAGNGYGTMFIPRIGMEVVVDFLEGDPDQPLVTGCVYNGVNKPPYALPGNATRSTIKTLSSKGGGGTNELRFEDKKGSEEVFLQAENALQVNVKGSKTEFVGYNYDLSVHNYLTVAVDQMMWLSTKDQLVIHSDTLAVLESETLNLRTKQDFRADAQQQMDLAAMNDIYVHSLSGNVSLVAAGTISLRAGPSFITLGASGVSIVGPSVNINSGGSPLSGSSLQGGQAFTDASKAHGTPDGTVIDPIQQLQAQALRNAAIIGAAVCEECEAARAAYAALTGGGGSGGHPGGGAAGGGAGSGGQSSGAGAGGGQGGSGGQTGGGAAGGGAGSGGQSSGAGAGGGQGGSGGQPGGGAAGGAVGGGAGSGGQSSGAGAGSGQGGSGGQPGGAGAGGGQGGSGGQTGGGSAGGGAGSGGQSSGAGAGGGQGGSGGQAGGGSAGAGAGSGGQSSGAGAGAGFDGGQANTGPAGGDTGGYGAGSSGQSGSAGAGGGVGGSGGQGGQSGGAGASGGQGGGDQGAGGAAGGGAGAGGQAGGAGAGGGQGGGY